MTKMRWVKLGGLLLFLLTLFGRHGAIRLYEIKSIARGLQNENRVLARLNQELAEEIVKLREPETLERIIRDERGYIRKDEMLLEIPDSP